MRKYYVPLSLALLVSMLMLAIAFAPDFFIKHDPIHNYVFKTKDSLQLFCYYQRVTDPFKKDTILSQDLNKIQQSHRLWLDSLYRQGIVITAGSSVVAKDDPRHFTMTILKAPDMMSASIIVSKDPALLYGTHIGEVIPFTFSHIVPKTYDGYTLE